MTAWYALVPSPLRHMLSTFGPVSRSDMEIITFTEQQGQLTPGCRAVKPPQPDARTHADRRRGKEDRAASDLHGGWYPEDVAESQEQVVQGAPAVHVCQRDACILRHRLPRRTQSVLAVGEGACVEREQEKLVIFLPCRPVERVSGV